MRKAIDIALLLVLFTFVSYLFIPFAFITPQGSAGTFDIKVIIASSIYLLAWISTSIYSGYKKLDNVLIAAMLYSCFPLGYIESPGGYQMGQFIFIIWSFPIQGFLTSNKDLQEIMLFRIAFVQPLIFATVYFATRCYSSIREKDKIAYLKK